MGAEFFQDISELKSYVGGGANLSVHLDSMAPTIYTTARRYIVPRLGQTFYDELLTAWQSGSPTSAQQAAITSLQRALALLSAHEYSLVGAIQLSEEGMFRIESEKLRSAFKYQERAWRQYMLEHGFDALEELLIYLEQHASDFPTYQNSEEYVANTEHFINHAAEFRLVYGQHIGRRAFESLRSIIDDVERFAVEHTLPRQFFDHLHDARKAGTLTAKEKEVVRLIRKAVAHFTVREATARMLLAIDGDRLVVREESGDDAPLRTLTPDDARLGAYRETHHVWANNYMAAMRQYVLDNPDDFPLAIHTDDGGSNSDDDAWRLPSDEDTTEPPPDGVPDLTFSGRDRRPGVVRL